MLHVRLYSTDLRLNMTSDELVIQTLLFLCIMWMDGWGLKSSINDYHLMYPVGRDIERFERIVWR